MCNKTEKKMLTENQLLEVINAERDFLIKKFQTQPNKQLLDDPIPFYLQVNVFKIPTGKGKLERLTLKHSKYPKDCEICLIVPDVKGIRNKEHEKHEEHYRNLLKQKNVETEIKKIMTFHEFRTEYDTFELKRRLVELYDVFIVGGQISGKVVRKCGKIFYNKRKVPTAIRLDDSNLERPIQNVLKKTQIRLHTNGDSFSIHFGNSQMDSKELVANIFEVMAELERKFPGGLDNIRNLNLYAPRGLHIPLFVSLKNSNSVPVPVISPKSVSKVLQKYPIRGELSTFLNKEVVVGATGNVKVKTIENSDDDEDDEDDDLL